VKKSPLNRKPWKRKPAKLKKTRLNRVSKKERKKLSDPLRKIWRATNCGRCMCCGIPAGKHGCTIDCHEMLDGKYGRPFDERNYLAMCRGRTDRPSCHDLCKGRERANGVWWPQITLSVQLMVKLIRDPGNYDWNWVRSIVGPSTPRPEPIPNIFFQ
jgi:hypothetical protein